MNCGIHNKITRTTSLLKGIDLALTDIQEKFLQELIDSNPGLIPFDEIDSSLDREFFSFGREIRTKAGPIDNLLGDARGEIVIVETKLWRNPESRRKVVAQIFDYMKELTKWNFEMLDAAVRNATKKSIQEITGQDDIEFQDYIDNAERNLKRGKIHLVLVGDGIREETNDLSQILKSSSLYEYTLNLIQLKLFQREQSDEIIIIPHILATAATIERIQLKVEFSGFQTAPTVQITDIIKEENATKTEQKIDEVDFLSQLTALNREKVQWMLNYFKTHPVVAIRWAGSSFLLYVPKENGQIYVNLLRVEKDVIKNRIYYHQIRSLGLIPAYQKEVDQYLEELIAIGIKIEKGKSSDDLKIVQQSLSNLTLDQIMKMTEIIDRAALRLSEVIGMVEELKTSIDS
ncbi:MAG TPA: hypothetical protein PLD02_14865 [Saprospiraceae bacterium]|nr:hypothetical protein [Saprospiraceae bacterium]